MNTQKARLLAVLLILALVALACGSKETPLPAPTASIQQSAAESPTQLPAKPAEATPVPSTATSPAPTPTSVPPTATPVPPTPTAVPPAPTSPPAAAESASTGLVAPGDALDSYRSRSTTTLLEQSGNAEMSIAGLLFGDRVIETEFVRDPKAMHVIMTDSGSGGKIESITIGEDTWINLGSNWMNVPTGSDRPAATGQESFQPTLDQMLKDLESGMKRLRKDVVNGVRCQRYSVDSQFTMPIPLPSDVPQEMMPKEMTGAIKGEICVADEPGLPPVVVHEQSVYDVTLTYGSGAEEMVKFQQDSELSDLNQPITIKPPM